MGKEKKRFLTSFYELYNSLKRRKKNDLIRFFEHKKQYSVHGDDVEYICVTYSGMSGHVKSEDGVPYIILKQNEFEYYISDLLQFRSKKIEVWKYDKQWKLSRKGSPGNIEQFEDIVLEIENQSTSTTHSFTTSNIMCIALKPSKSGKIDMSAIDIGITCVDSFKNKIICCQFYDNHHLAILESLVIQLGVRECILLDRQSDDQDSIVDKIVTILQKCKVPYEIKNYRGAQQKTLYQSINAEDAVQKLLPEGVNLMHYEHIIKDHPLSIDALLCLIQDSSLNMLHNSNHEHRYSITQYNADQFVRLDASALLALNIVKADPDDPSCIISFMDRCKTRMGSRLMEVWVRQPLQNIEMIQERQQIVSILVDDAYLKDTLRSSFKKIPDLDVLLRRIYLKRAKLSDLVRIDKFLNIIPDLIDAMGENGSPILNQQFIVPLQSLQQQTSFYRKFLGDILEPYTESDKQYLINHKYNEDIYLEYQSYQKKLRKLRMETKSFIERNQLRDWSLERDPSNTVYPFYHLQILKKHDKALSILPIKRINTSRASKRIKFTTPKVEKLAHGFETAFQSYETIQETYVQQAVACARTYCHLFDQLRDIIAQLDCLMSYATVALEQQYCKPTILEKEAGVMNLKQVRHPLLEDRVDDYIANDVKMGGDGARFVILTGPNMGGKSTYIRSAALVVLLAQIGSFVPCLSASLSICDCIMARVGANDFFSLVGGKSTMMMEMLELSTILKTVTRHSMVVIDECGRGTSTTDAYALAAAISEHLISNVGCFCLFATHFHELAQLSSKFPTQIANRHVTVSPDNMVMLYQIAEGCSSESFGVHVANMCHFPPVVTSLADDNINYMKRQRSTTQDLNQDAPPKRPCLPVHMQEALQSFCRMNFIGESLTPGQIEKLKEIKQWIHSPSK